MGQHLRRRRVGLGHLGPAAAPLRGHLHQRPQLSAQGPPQPLRWRWCPGVTLLALLPTYQPVPETTSALDPGQWMPWHAERPPGASGEPTKSARLDQVAGRVAGSGAELVGGALVAGGRACQEPSGQIPPSWAWWENEPLATRA